MIGRRSLTGLILLCLMLSSITVLAQDDLIQVSQWADSAKATSQYGDDSWSAEQATGRPDVNACEDNTAAWASEGYDGEESLSLVFDDAVIPTQINIFQTLAPGAIIAIELLPEDEDPIRYDIEDQDEECPAILSVNLPDDLPETNSLIIHFDMTIVNNWNEIDAVELVGLVEGDEDDADESSIESGRYDEYEVFTVDAGGTGETKGEPDNDDDTDTDTIDMDWGRDITCRDGTEIEGGVELTVIQQRTGNQYRITAIGLDGFDPVLGVTLTGNYNDALCNDDDGEAATYSADLPTTGGINTSGTSSQVIFNLNSGNAFEDVSIVVGGFGSASGEYLLIIEGMYASSADGLGDPMSLWITPSLVESGVDPASYMISVVGAFDPLMYLINADYEQIADDNGDPILCDDAGSESLCWGDSDSLVGSYVSRSQNRQLPGGGLDSMITLEADDSNLGFYYNYLFTSYGTTEGDYIVAFHLGYEAED